MDKGGYIVIQDWMLRLDLDLTETMMYAVIYSFSQDGESTFRGSQAYLATKCKCSRAKVTRTLPKLVAMGLIEKTDRNINGIHLCEYSATDTGCITEIQGVVSQRYRGCITEIHNNKEYIINNNKDNISLSFPFSSPRFIELWDTLVSQPKWKKKTTQALQMCLDKLGRQPEEVALQMMEDSIANGWQGVFPPKGTVTTRKSNSVYEHNRRIVENIQRKLYDTGDSNI